MLVTRDGGGERAPDSATIMTTTTTSVAKMDMFRLVWLFLTNVFRLVLDVYERRSIFWTTYRKRQPVYGSSFSGRQFVRASKPVRHRLWRYLFVGNLVDFGKLMLIHRRFEAIRSFEILKKWLGCRLLLLSLSECGR